MCFALRVFHILYLRAINVWYGIVTVRIVVYRGGSRLNVDQIRPDHIISDQTRSAANVAPRFTISASLLQV